MKIFHAVSLSYNEEQKFFRLLKIQFIRKVRNTMKEIHMYIAVLTGTSDSGSSFSQGAQRCRQKPALTSGITLQSYRIPLRTFFLTTRVKSWKPQRVCSCSKAFQCKLSHKQTRWGFSRTVHMLQLSKCLSALLVRNRRFLLVRSSLNSHPFVVVGVGKGSQIDVTFIVLRILFNLQIRTTISFFTILITLFCTLTKKYISKK